MRCRSAAFPLKAVPPGGTSPRAEAFLSAPALVCQEVQRHYWSSVYSSPLASGSIKDPSFPGDAPRWRGLSVLRGSGTQRRLVWGQGEATQAAGLGASGTSQTLPEVSPFSAASLRPKNFWIVWISSRYSLAEAKMCSPVAAPQAL